MQMLDLLGIKNSVGALAGQVKELGAKIENLKRQREDIATAPPALEDVKAAYVAAVEARRASFRDGLARFVGSFKASPDAVMGALGHGRLLFMASDSYVAPYPSVLVENGIAALFSEQVIKAMSSELEALDWSEAGLPMAKRKKKLESLDAEIAALERNRNELITGARNAGVTIHVDG